MARSSTRRRLGSVVAALALHAALIAALTLSSFTRRPEARLEEIALVDAVPPAATPAPKPEPKADVKPEARPEPKPEPKAEAKPEPKPEPKAETKAEPKTEPAPQPKAERAPTPVPTPPTPEPATPAEPTPPAAEAPPAVTPPPAATEEAVAARVEPAIPAPPVPEPPPPVTEMPPPTPSTPVARAPSPPSPILDRGFSLRPDEPTAATAEINGPSILFRPPPPATKAPAPRQAAARIATLVVTPAGGGPAHAAYPEAARRNGEQGDVLVEVDIDPTGAVRGARVKRSSGHASLDAAALRSGAALRFRPPRPPDGARLVGTILVEVPFSYRLP